MIVGVALTAFALGGNAVAIEEAKYEVLSKDKQFELRNYASHIVAETVVDGTLEDAGNQAFNKLFAYISGKNRSQDKIAMTAPVTQKSAVEKIEMTAPVGQQRVAGGWAVSFMMPGKCTLETLPAPDDPEVKLRSVPACKIAAVRYSGGWSEKLYRQNLDDLKSWITKEGFKIVGEPVWARYNPPFTPWFLRRNEILIPIEATLAPSTTGKHS
jgi:hypothetical protein